MDKQGSMMSSKWPPFKCCCLSPGVNLIEEHLREVKCLRQRLEESIRTNERLRQQLEEKLATSGRDGGTAALSNTLTTLFIPFSFRKITTFFLFCSSGTNKHLHPRTGHRHPTVQ